MTKETVFNTSECDWRRRLQQMQESIETLRTELENRLRVETLLAEISAHSINLPADQIDSAVAELAPQRGTGTHRTRRATAEALFKATEEKLRGGR